MPTKLVYRAVTEDLQMLVAAIFPENFTFDGVNVQTARLQVLSNRTDF